MNPPNSGQVRLRPRSQRGRNYIRNNNAKGLTRYYLHHGASQVDELDEEPGYLISTFQKLTPRAYMSAATIWVRQQDDQDFVCHIM